MPIESYYSCTLQMKGRWESNFNVWFPFMYYQKWNCYFQNRIKMFYLPVPLQIYLWKIYIFPGLVCLICCRKIFGPILGIYKSLTDIWMWNWDWGHAIPRKEIHKWYFRSSVESEKTVCYTLRPYPGYPFLYQHAFHIKSSFCECAL